MPSINAKKANKNPFPFPMSHPTHPHFWIWTLCKLYLNQTLSFFDTMTRLSLTSSGKSMVFFLTAVVLEVERSMMWVTHWGTEQFAVLSFFVPSVVSTHQMSARIATGHCYSALKRRAEWFAEIPGSSDTDRRVTASAGSQTVQWQWAPAAST